MFCVLRIFSPLLLRDTKRIDIFSLPKKIIVSSQYTVSIVTLQCLPQLYVSTGQKRAVALLITPVVLAAIPSYQRGL